jgi:hypothetical protein
VQADNRGCGVDDDGDEPPDGDGGGSGGFGEDGGDASTVVRPSKTAAAKATGRRMTVGSGSSRDR